MTKLKILTLSLLTTWFIVGFSTARLPGINYLKSKKVNYMIERQLPLGSTQAQAKAFLEQQGVDTYLHNRPDSSAQIYAMLRATQWGGIVIVDTQYILSFNSFGQLDKVSIEPIATGP